MPCWTVNMISVEFSAKHLTLLMAAIKSMGLNGYYSPEDETIEVEDQIVINLKNQTANVYGDNFDALNRLKRAYSKTVIETVAKKRRWSVQTVGGENKMRLRRW